LRSDVQAAQTAVDRVTNASNQIVVFGVFLVGVTLLGVVVDTLTGQIENLPAHVSDLRLGFIIGMIVLYVLACFAGVGFVAISSWKTVSNRQSGK
jgi:Mn2+/Fe2+ NRAMP family transporter